MDRSFTDTVLRLAELASDTAIKLGALLACGTLLVVVAVTHAAMLVPLLGLFAVGLLVWRPVQALPRRGAALAPSERALLERRLQLLEDQIQLLQQEQTCLHATVRWQAQMLERLGGERSASTRA
jgi:hypothetical protein